MLGTVRWQLPQPAPSPVTHASLIACGAVIRPRRPSVAAAPRRPPPGARCAPRHGAGQGRAGGAQRIPPAPRAGARREEAAGAVVAVRIGLQYGCRQGRGTDAAGPVIVMQESGKSRSVSPRPVWLQRCFAVPKPWAPGGQRAGAFPIHPAKPGAGETLRARCQQKPSCEGGSRGGFGPFSPSLPGELRQPRHPQPPAAVLLPQSGRASRWSRGQAMARAHLPPRARGTLPRWPMVRPTFTPHEVREKWGVGAGGAPSVLGGL